MTIKKIVSMENMSNNLTDDGGGVYGCLTGSCPTVYQTDNGDYVVQGFVLSNADKQILSLPENEDAVLIPKKLIDLLRG